MSDIKYQTSILTDKVTIVRNNEATFNPDPVSIPHIFIEHTKEYDDYIALVSKDDVQYSYKEYFNQALKAAKGFNKLGLKSKDVIGIIGFNSPEYFFTFHGCWLNDCVSAGIYTTNNAEACRYVLSDSHAKVCVCEGGKQAQKIMDLVDQLPELQAIIVYWPDSGMPTMNANRTIQLYKWEDFVELGQDIETETILNIAESVDPGTCATLIYTSGTTGTPKGVMCSHDACMYNALALRNLVALDDKERLISYLPLSHIAAQYIDVMTAVRNRGTMYFADPDCLKGTLLKSLLKCRPTIFVGVPRVYEKIAELMRSTILKMSSIKQYLFSWAQSIGSTSCDERQFDKSHYLPWGYTLAKYLVFDTVRAQLGLEKCRFCVCSAAPLTPDTLNFFNSLDINIYDLYGQSEATAPISMNTPVDYVLKMGSSGLPFPGIEMAVTADTHELMYRGRNTMMGYLNLPEETKHVKDEDRYIHTGDMGYIDKDGFIFITGRLKELIVTAGGENVPPVYIENKLTEICSSISNVLVIGDKRKYLSCLISLKTKADQNGEPTNRLNSECLKQSELLNSSSTTIEDVLEDEKWTTYINRVIEEYNYKYAISRAQYIRKWAILKRDLSITNGELTNTMKVKRNVYVYKLVFIELIVAFACDFNEYEATLVRKYTLYASEEIVEIYKGVPSTNVQIFYQKGTYSQETRSYNYTLCLEPTLYTVVLSDTKGDGWGGSVRYDSFVRISIGNVQIYRGSIAYPTSTPTFSKTDTFNPTFLIPHHSSWKYRDISQTTNDWIYLGYADSNWSTGVGSYFPSKSTITRYYRYITALPSFININSFSISLLTEFGVIIYINGQEIYRDNLPDENVISSTVSSSPSYSNPTYRQIHINKNKLPSSGQLCIAIEAHSHGDLSISDSFDVIGIIHSSEVNSCSSNILLDGTVSASMVTSDTYNNMNMAFDMDTFTMFATTETDHIEFVYTLPNHGSVNINKYSITSSRMPNYGDPSNWTIYASNDNIHYSLLDIRQNIVFSLRRQTLSYTITNENSYKYYKFSILSSTMTNKLALSTISSYSCNYEHINTDLHYEYSIYEGYKDITTFNIIPAIVGYTNFIISPSLPNSIEFNINTGTIYGISQVSLEQIYTINATQLTTGIAFSTTITLRIQECSAPNNIHIRITKQNGLYGNDEHFLFTNIYNNITYYTSPSFVSSITYIESLCIPMGILRVVLIDNDNDGWSKNSNLRIENYLDIGIYQTIAFIYQNDISDEVFLINLDYLIYHQDINWTYIQNNIPLNWLELNNDNSNNKNINNSINNSNNKNINNSNNKNINNSNNKNINNSNNNNINNISNNILNNNLSSYLPYVPSQPPLSTHRIWVFKHNMYIENKENYVGFEITIKTKGGFIIYINSLEYHRYNVINNTASIDSLYPINSNIDTKYIYISGPTTLLNNGNNVIHILMIHNDNYPTYIDFDCSFQLLLFNKIGRIWDITLSSIPEVLNLSYLFDMFSDTVWNVYLNDDDKNAYIYLDYGENRYEYLNRYCFRNTNQNYARDPSDWMIYGSNDNIQYIFLGETTNAYYSQRNQIRCFYLPLNKNSWRYYKIIFIENANPLITPYQYSLSEIILSLYNLELSIPHLSLNTTIFNAYINVPFPETTPNSDMFTGYTISPALELPLELDTSTGSIRGIPLVSMPSSIYTLSAYTPDGRLDSISITLSINYCSSPNILFYIMVHTDAFGDEMQFWLKDNQNNILLEKISLPVNQDSYYPFCELANQYTLILGDSKSDGWLNGYIKVYLEDNTELLKTTLPSGLSLYTIDLTIGYICPPLRTLWNYVYTQNNLNNDWITLDYDDSDWLQSVSITMDDPTTITQYYRSKFNIINILNYVSLAIDIKTHFGCIVYINGHEILRYNMPMSTITSSTYCMQEQLEIKNIGSSFSILNSYLKNSNNIIAIEIHRSKGTMIIKNDFDASLLLTQDNSYRIYNGYGISDIKEDTSINSLFDNNIGSITLSGPRCVGAISGYIYNNSRSEYVSSYSIVTGYKCNSRNPTGWYFEGLLYDKEGNEQWYILDIQSNQLASQYSKRFTYDFYTEKSYNGFRIRVTECNNKPLIQYGTSEPSCYYTMTTSTGSTTTVLNQYGYQLAEFSLYAKKVIANCPNMESINGFQGALEGQYSYKSCPQYYTGRIQSKCIQGEYQKEEIYCTEIAPTLILYSKSLFTLISDESFSYIPTINADHIQCSNQPNFPDGIYFKTDTGEIYGKINTLFNQLTFNITCKNSVGSVSTIIYLIGVENTNQSIWIYIILVLLLLVAVLLIILCIINRTKFLRNKKNYIAPKMKEISQNQQTKGIRIELQRKV
ncbi:hypothetical protein WA158_000808 [Blastocystis sp. Blastoise]